MGVGVSGAVGWGGARVREKRKYGEAQDVMNRGREGELRGIIEELGRSFGGLIFFLVAPCLHVPRFMFLASWLL